MATHDTDMDQAQLEAYAKATLARQKKLLKERDRLRRFLSLSEGHLRAAERDGLAEEATFFGLYVQLLQGYMRQFELLNPSTEILTVPEPATLMAMEWQNLVNQMLSLRLEAINLGRVDRLLAADLEPAAAGQPPVLKGPAAWQALRAQFATHPDWVEALRRFHADFPAFREAVVTATGLMDELTQAPAGPGRLQRARDAHLPALRGELYRLEAHLRFPEVQALVAAVRVFRADEGPSAASEDAAAVVPRKRNLTDKIKDIFRVSDA
jgi:hypothetical protein